MVMFCRFGTLLRSITPPLLSPNSPHYGSKSIARVYSCIVYPCSFFTFCLFIFFLINRLGKIFLFFFLRSYLSTSDKFLSKSIIFGFDIIIRFFYFKNKSRQNLIQINITFLRIVKKRVKLFLIMQKNIQEEWEIVSIQNLLERRVSLVNTLTNSTYAKDETRNETNNWNVATHSSRRKSLYRRAFRATRRKFGRPDSYRFEGMFAGCWRCRDSVGGGGIGGGGGGGGEAVFSNVSLEKCRPSSGTGRHFVGWHGTAPPSAWTGLVKPRKWPPSTRIFLFSIPPLTFLWHVPIKCYVLAKEERKRTRDPRGIERLRFYAATAWRGR